MELYHYTSTDTMRYILTERNIYATNIRYMNDSEEYINGVQELYTLAWNEPVVRAWINQKGYDESLLHKIQETFSENSLKENKNKMEYYSISFCKKSDLLSQWAIYAKESGVSIKMNFEEKLYQFLTKSSDRNSAKWNLLPQDVYYFTRDSMKEEEYKQVSFKLLDQLYLVDSKDSIELKEERWRYVSTLVKRYDFYQEDEARLVFDPTMSSFPPKIEYRNDKKVLKPYLDVKCELGWPIWEIMIGPGFNQQVVFNSIGHFLDHADVKVGIKKISCYIKRIKKYLEPCKGKLDKCIPYQELEKQLAKKEWVEEAETDEEKMEEAKIFFVQKMNAIRKEVCEDTLYEEVRPYFDEHYFARSGVVLTKSHIPYIF